MSPKPCVKEERTQEIIEAALKVFSHDGFHDATMDDIAHEAGVSKGTLYLYFKGKDKIINSLLEWFFQREYSRFNRFVDTDLPARETIEKIAYIMIDDLIKVKPLLPVMYEFISLSARNRGIGEVIKKKMYDFMERVQPIFEKGIAEGELKDLDPKSLVYAYGALIEGTILFWSYDVNNIELRETLTSSLKIFLDGIMKKQVIGG